MRVLAILRVVLLIIDIPLAFFDILTRADFRCWQELPVTFLPGICNAITMRIPVPQKTINPLFSAAISTRFLPPANEILRDVVVKSVPLLDEVHREVSDSCRLPNAPESSKYNDQTNKGAVRNKSWLLGSFGISLVPSLPIFPCSILTRSLRTTAPASSAVITPRR